MNKIPAPKPVDLNLFSEGRNDLEVKFGLPREIVFCKSCVISNQRPLSAVEFSHTRETSKETIHFNEEGVCDACVMASLKERGICWEDREKELKDLCDRYRSKDGKYDCLVPGSGGKDSFFAAHILKNKYGMHPLTVTWAPHIYTDWGWKNFQAWIHAGHDNYLMTPNGRVHRLLTRLAVDNLFHPFQPFVIGQKALVPKIAAIFKIPLVFYGENEAEYGNRLVDGTRAQRDMNYFAVDNSREVYLGGLKSSDLKNHFGLEQQDLIPYLPARREEIEENKIEVHYLGYYLNWHPQACYYYAVEHGGFQASPERTTGTYSKYNSIDDKMDDFHYYTTGVKFGIGRATYDAAQEIRNGEIFREEGVALVRKFDLEFPSRFMDEIFQYLSISPDEFPIASRMFEQPIMDLDYFITLADNFRSPHLWKWDNGQWKLRQAVYHEELADRCMKG